MAVVKEKMKEVIPEWPYEQDEKSVRGKRSTPVGF